MDDIDHPALIEEWKQNIDTAVYEKNPYKYLKLPSIRKQFIVMIETKNWTKIVKESLNWFSLQI